MVNVEATSSEGRDGEGGIRRKRKRDVDVEAKSAEIVASNVEGRDEDGGSRKKRKRVKDGSSVSDGNTIEFEAGALNEKKTDSSNGRKKEKKKKHGSVHEQPPLREAANKKLGDVGVLVGDDKAGGRNGRLEKSVEEGTETEYSERSIERKKEKKKKHSMDEESVLQEDNQATGQNIRHARDSIDEAVTGNSENPSDRKREKNRKKHRIEQEPVSQEAPVGDNEGNRKEVDKATTKSSEFSENKKKMEKKKKKQRIEQERVSQEAPVGDSEAETKELGTATTKNSESLEDRKKKKKKKQKKQRTDQEPVSRETPVGNNKATTQKSQRSEDRKKKEKKKKKKKNRSNDVSDGSPPKPTSKRVSFSEDVQVFPISNDNEATGQDKQLVRGKRFTREEDELIKAAVLEYIDSHALGDEGIKMVMNCRKQRETRNCWKEISSALPWRPIEGVYYRAHTIFQRDENRKWSPEENEIVLKFHEKYGKDWKTLAEALGKHRIHVKDAYRRLRLKNRKSGRWSQDEYQTLFDLVNADLRMKVFEEERKSKHGMLRDNISWDAIGDKLQTRLGANCCDKWYQQLTSPMVADGKWLDTDDYQLVMELYNLDACCMEDVDWDSLLEHRSGDMCRMRWNQMVKHLGDTSNKSFAELVDTLSKRYCFDVREAKEIYYSKPLVN